MADLVPQLIDIPIVGGVDEKTDDKVSLRWSVSKNVSRPKIGGITRRNSSGWLPNSTALAPQGLRSLLNSPAAVGEDLWPLPHIQPYVFGGAAAGDTFQALRPQILAGAFSVSFQYAPPQYASDHFVESILQSPLGTTATDSAWTYFVDASTGANMVAEANISNGGGSSSVVIKHYPISANPQEINSTPVTTQFTLGSGNIHVACGAARILGSNGVILIYANAGAVSPFLIKYDPTTLTFTNSVTVPSASPPTVWDWRFDGAGNVFIAQSIGGIAITVYKIALSTLTVSSSQTITAASIPTAICIAESDLATLTVFWAETTAKTVRCATSTTAAFAAFTIQAGAMNAGAAAVTAISAAERTLPGYSGVTAFGTLWAQTSSGAAFYQQQVTVKSYVASAFTQPIGAWDYTYYGSYLVSKCLQDRAGQLAMLAFDDGNAQRTYFLAWFSIQAGLNQTPGSPISAGYAGKTLYAVAGGQLAVNAQLPNFLPMPAANYTARRSGTTSVTFSPGAQVAGLRIAGGTPAAPTKVGALMKWLFPAVYGLFENREWGASIFSGGALAQYDGGNLVELGFWLAPEVVAISASGAAGFVSAGVYTVIAVCVTTDAHGQVIRSSAGPAVPVTAAALNTINVTTTQLQHTNRLISALASSGQVQIEIYRTLANGTTYYLDTTIGSSIGSTVTIATNLTQADATLQTNRILYTAGALNNFSPDGSGVAGSALGRIWCADPVDEDIYHYSQTALFGVGANFCAEFQDKLPGGGPAGRMTAFIGMDDKCIIAKRHGLWYVSGDGPTIAGTGSFTKAQLIPCDLGILNEKAWVLIPQGIIFASEKGVWLLGHDLSLSYVGKDVEDHFFDYPSTDPTTIPGAEARAIHVSDQNQVRFIFRSTSLGARAPFVAVYDYMQGTWDYHDPMASSDLTKTFAMSDLLSVNGQIYQSQMASDGTAETLCIAKERYDYLPETTTAANIPGVGLVSGWVKSAGMQGFEKLLSLFFLLKTVIANSTYPTIPADWTLTVSIAYDYDPTIRETHTITYANMVNGGLAPQFRIDAAAQGYTRCQSFQITIAESFPTTAAGFLWQLDSIQALIGVLPGGARLPSAKRA